MSSSSTPANNNVAYGHLLALSSKLKRQDQVSLVRALAGQLGMIALFPAQLTSSAVSSGSGAKAPSQKMKAKGPAKQAPSNPLSGSAEKKEFDAAKKAVANATKAAGGQKLPPTDELVLALESAKDKYFRALSVAKGTVSEDDVSSSDEDEKALSKAISNSRLLSSSPPKAESSKQAAARSSDRLAKK